MPAKTTIGTALKSGTISIAGVTSVDMAFARNTQEVTSLSSTAVEMVGTVADFGEISGSIVWDNLDTSHKALFALFLAGTVTTHEVDFPDGSKATGSGFYTKLDIKQETNDVGRADYSLRTSGPWSFTYPS